jgi:prophage maintenance system killer protein
MALHYLTVQDMLWINHRVTGKVNAFDYDRLEQGTFLQYGYGKSLDLAKQAAAFLNGFAKKQPFEEGNEATGFVGFVAFLRSNGKDVRLDANQAREWIASGADADRVAATIVEGEPIHGTPDVEGIVEEVVEAFAESLGSPTAA